MVDNFEQIVNYINFNSDDEFYYLQLIQRKKEIKDLGSNSKKVVKNYYIKSKDELLFKKKEIIDLCNVFGCRAMIRLNKRSFKRIAFKAMENIVNSISCEQYSFIRNSYDRACGLLHSDPNKTWIIDIDKNELQYLDTIINVIRSVEPFSDRILLQLPSKTGVHLITRPFNVADFNERLKQTFPIIVPLEIHKDNPTNLYCP